MITDQFSISVQKLVLFVVLNLEHDRPHKWIEQLYNHEEHVNPGNILFLLFIIAHELQTSLLSKTSIFIA